MGAELLEVAELYGAVRADRVVVVRLRHVLVQQVNLQAKKGYFRLMVKNPCQN